MNRGTLLAIILAILVAAIAVGFWMTRNNGPETPVVPAASSEPSDTSAEPVPLPPPPAPKPAEPTAESAEKAPEQPSQAVVDAFAEALKDVEEKEPDGDDEPFEGVPITEETLTGVKYKEFDGKVEIEFAANHKWLVNGRERAKWEIVGSKVRIYDDKGEEHWADIDGDKLLFEGQRLELWK